MEISVLQTGILDVNTFIVPLCDNNVFIVDPAACNFSSMFFRCNDESVIFDYLCEKNLNPQAIVLTHGHFDHVSGLRFLKEKYPSIPVLIHKEDVSLIGKDSENSQSKDLKSFRLTDFLPIVSNLPEATDFLEDGKTLSDCISENLDENVKNAFSDWKILHTPGHTKGSICLLNEKDDVLISGDTLFYHSYGRTDLNGGSEISIYESLEKLRKVISSETKIYPGHDRFGFTKKD